MRKVMKPGRIARFRKAIKAPIGPRPVDLLAQSRERHFQQLIAKHAKS